MTGAEPCTCDQHPLGARLIDWRCPTHGLDDWPDEMIFENERPRLT